LEQDLTRLAMERHLGALHGDRFDIGGLLDGSMTMRLWGLERALRNVDTLKAWNLKGAAIYVRPARQTGTVLLDDLDRARIDALTGEGYPPACVVETSPGNFQVWLRLVANEAGKTLDTKVVSRAIRILVERYDADLNSADWRHYGRLGGFTNRKPAYQQADGRFPFVLVHEADGTVAPAGRALLLRAKAELAAEAEHRGLAPKVQTRQGGGMGSHAQRRSAVLMRNLDQPWASDPDESILDWMIVCEALKQGWSPAAVSEMLAQRKDIGQKHNIPDYVGRTVRKAIAHVTGGEKPGE